MSAAKETMLNAMPSLVPTFVMSGVRLATVVGIRHWKAPLARP